MIMVAEKYNHKCIFVLYKPINIKIMNANDLPKESIFYFNREEYDWDRVKTFTLEECLSNEGDFENFPEFVNSCNSEDCSDWICDFYVRIFPSQDKECEIYTWDEFSVILNDGRKCSTGTNGSLFVYEKTEDDEDYLCYDSLEIPQEILNELCEKNEVKKVTIEEFEQMHADEDFCYAVSVRYK